MMLYCKTEDALATLVQNQMSFMKDGHKIWPQGCSACGEWLCDFNDFESDDDHIVVTADVLARLAGTSGYPAPISTADELPPEHTDILWWYPRGEYRHWNFGMYNTDEEHPPGCLRASGNRWWLCNGPTWWMYPPLDPTAEETE